MQRPDAVIFRRFVHQIVKTINQTSYAGVTTEQ